MVRALLSHGRSHKFESCSAHHFHFPVSGVSPQTVFFPFAPFRQKKIFAKRRIPCFHGTRCETPDAFLNASRFATYQR